MRRGLLRHTSFAVVPALQKPEEKVVTLSGAVALKMDAVVEEVIRRVIRRETRRAAAAAGLDLIPELAELQSRFGSVRNSGVVLRFQEVVFVVDAAAVVATEVVLDGCPSFLAFGLVMVWSPSGPPLRLPGIGLLVD